MAGSGTIINYPNPSEDIFNIESRLDVEVEVYDLMGKRLIKEKSKRIDMSGYPTGVYNFTIIYDKMRWNKRVIKQ